MQLIHVLHKIKLEWWNGQWVVWYTRNTKVAQTWKGDDISHPALCQKTLSFILVRALFISDDLKMFLNAPM